MAPGRPNRAVSGRFIAGQGMPVSIIIDTDPGQDDAVAILLALASPEDLDVRGIVAVAGNVPLERTALNARQVVRLAYGHRL